MLSDTLLVFKMLDVSSKATVFKSIVLRVVVRIDHGDQQLLLVICANWTNIIEGNVSLKF